MRVTFAEQIVRSTHRASVDEEEFYAARDAAPPGERWELVYGEVLVTPSPHWTHQHWASSSPHRWT